MLCIALIHNYNRIFLKHIQFMTDKNLKINLIQHQMFIILLIQYLNYI